MPTFAALGYLVFGVICYSILDKDRKCRGDLNILSFCSLLEVEGGVPCRKVATEFLMPSSTLDLHMLKSSKTCLTFLQGQDVCVGHRWI